MILTFCILFNLKFKLLRAKINFNLLKIYSIAVSSAIIVRDLIDYVYVRIILDFAIFP